MDKKVKEFIKMQYESLRRVEEGQRKQGKIDTLIALENFMDTDRRLK